MLNRIALLLAILLATASSSWCQNSPCEKPATIVVFRTFNIFNYLFSYKLYASDSLMGRIKIHDVLVLETYDNGISFHATTKAPSLNASRKSNYQNRKSIRYSFSLKAGALYFVKCDFLNQRLFEYPRQPTIRLLKKGEESKFLKRRFLKRKLKTYLFNEWLQDT